MADYTGKLERLIADPADMGLRWQLGIDQDILDDRIRNGEIIAWIQHEIL
jgi:GMP synthase (glutamine-hydrolysing)